MTSYYFPSSRSNTDMDSVMAKQIKSGLNGITADLQGMLVGTVLGIIVGAAFLGIASLYAICLYIVITSLVGSNPIPGGQVAMASTVIVLGLIGLIVITALKVRRTLPELLVKRGQAYEREQKAQLARERLAARGAYTDPRRNKSTDSERK